MSNSKVVWLLMVVVLVTAVFSQEEVPEQLPFNPYNLPTTYALPDFYTSSDPSLWRWEYVNWDLIDFNQLSLYHTPEFYANLPEERYGDLNYRLIPDFNLIADHSLIDGIAYVQDFGCTRCDLAIDQLGLIRYDREGRIFHLNSGDTVYVGDFPASTAFRVDNAGIFIECSSEATSLCASERGTYTITTGEEEIIEEVFVDRTLDYQGHAVSGSLSFRDGQPYVQEGDGVIIDRISIHNSGEPFGIDVYFDPFVHQGSFVSFGEANLVISSEYGQSSYLFFPGNNYLDVPSAGIEEGPGTNQLAFFPTAGSTMIVQDRREQDLVPRVTIVAKGDEPTFFRNGANRFELRSDAAYIQTNSWGGGSTPLALVPLNDRGVNILGEGMGKILLFDEQNNFITVDESLEPEEVQCLDCVEDFTEENDVLYDYYTAQIMEALPANQLFADFTRDPVVLGKLLRTLQRLPLSQRETILQLWVAHPELVQSEEFCGANANGCASSRSRRIIMDDSSFMLSEGGFPHEVAHEWTYHQEGLDAERILRDQVRIDELVALYGSLENIPQSEWERVIRERSAEPTSGYFQTRWETIAGDVYQQNLGEPTVSGVNANTWSDGVSGEPRYGCFRAYGCNNFYEDVATATEEFYDESQRIRELINPESSFYSDRVDQEIGNTGEVMTPEIAREWAIRYRGRVELLYEYGFITEEQYRSVIGQPEEQQATNDEGAGYGP